MAMQTRTVNSTCKIQRKKNYLPVNCFGKFTYCNLQIKKANYKKRNWLMSVLPKLVRSTPQGGTIHKYQLTGGKTSFMRYLGCYLGTCKFCNDINEASEFVSSIEISPKSL